MSLIEVSNIYIEDLFEWFSSHIAESAGDGCGYIVCKNYREAADFYSKWFERKFGKSIPHPRDEYENVINYHDSNENFIFTDTIPENSFEYDYVFVVKDACKSAREKFEITNE